MNTIQNKIIKFCVKNYKEFNKCINGNCKRCSLRKTTKCFHNMLEHKLKIEGIFKKEQSWNWSFDSNSLRIYESNVSNESKDIIINFDEIKKMKNLRKL